MKTDLIEFSETCQCGNKIELKFENAPLETLAEECAAEVESQGWTVAIKEDGYGECPTCHERNANEYKADFLADR